MGSSRAVHPGLRRHIMTVGPHWLSPSPTPLLRFSRSRPWGLPVTCSIHDANAANQPSVSLSATPEYDRSRQPAIPCVAPALTTLAGRGGPEHDYVSCIARAGFPTRWHPPKRLPRDTRSDGSTPDLRRNARRWHTTVSDEPLRRPKPSHPIRLPLRDVGRNRRRSPPDPTLPTPACRSSRLCAEPAMHRLARIRAPSTTCTTVPDRLRMTRRPWSVCLSAARANPRAFQAPVFAHRGRIVAAVRTEALPVCSTEVVHSTLAAPPPTRRQATWEATTSTRGRCVARRRPRRLRKRRLHEPPARSAFAVALTCAPLCASRDIRRCSSLDLDANASASRLALTRESKTPS
jgi:hypothetical protein